MAYTPIKKKNTKTRVIKKDFLCIVSQEKNEKASNNEIHTEDLSKITSQNKIEHTQLSLRIREKEHKANS